MLAGEDFGQGDAFVLGLVGQHRPADDIADRINAGRGRLEALVDQNLPALHRDADRAADATVLAPAIALDGFGQDSPSPVAARGLPASAIASSPASPQHPPGLYGSEANRRALSLGSATPAPEAAPPLQGAREETLGETAPDRAIGPSLLAAAILLLVADLIASLALRGLLVRGRARVAASAALILLMAGSASAAEQGAAALTTRLAYVVTGDARVDDVSRAGLAGLSEG